MIKRQCPRCDTINEGNLTECKSCGKYIADLPAMEDIPLTNANSGSDIFKTLVYIGVILAVILFIITVATTKNIGLAFAVCISLLMFSVLMYAIKRIIDLLFEIRNKLDK